MYDVTSICDTTAAVLAVESVSGMMFKRCVLQLVLIDGRALGMAEENKRENIVNTTHNSQPGGYFFMYMSLNTV